MIIKRTINGKEISIELTSDELSAAYDEQEFNYDVQDIKNEIEREDFSDDYGISAKTLEPYIDSMASVKRRKMYHDDMDWKEAVEAAIKEQIEELSYEDNN